MAANEHEGWGCPDCGGREWHPLLDWRREASFGAQHVACATCGLTASLVGVTGAVVPDVFQAEQDQVTIDPADIEVEWLEPADGRGGARIVHAPTGITVEALAYSTHAENAHAALQALALQLAERRRHHSSST